MDYELAKEHAEIALKGIIAELEKQKVSESAKREIFTMAKAVGKYYAMTALKRGMTYEDVINMPEGDFWELDRRAEHYHLFEESNLP